MKFVMDESMVIHVKDKMMDGKVRANEIYIGWCG
jgi:hypothetical protein